MADVLHMRLKELRYMKGFTQREVANNLLLPLRTYQNYERGVNSPDIEMVCCMADLYGVSVDFLVGHDATTGQIDSAYSTNLVLLDDDEQLILNGYRDCNGEGKAALMSIVQVFADSQQYGAMR